MALELLREWDAWPVLVVAPKGCAHVWPEQAKLWLDRPCRVITSGDMTERCSEVSRTHRGIAVVNYEALWGLRKTLGRMEWGGIVLDEAKMIATPGARMTRVVDTYLRWIEHRIALTAWPIHKHLDDVFAPFRFVDGGDALGRTFSDFRWQYFIPEPDGYGWTPRGGAEREVADKIRSKSVVLVDAEMKRLAGLPDAVFERIEVELDGKGREIYREAKKDWSVLGEDIDGAGVRAMRMMQACHGVALEQFFGGAKAEALVKFVGELPADERIVVFGWYRAEIEGLAEMLAGQGRGVYTARGGDDLGAKLGAWKRDPGGIFVCQAGMGIGWAATEARYCLFHSRPYSASARHQCIGRLVRAGQRRVVTVVDFVASGTVDAGYLKVLAEEKDFIDLVRNLIQFGLDGG